MENNSANPTVPPTDPNASVSTPTPVAPTVDTGGNPNPIPQSTPGGEPSAVKSSGGGNKTVILVVIVMVVVLVLVIGLLYYFLSTQQAATPSPTPAAQTQETVSPTKDLEDEVEGVTVDSVDNDFTEVDKDLQSL